MLIEVIEPRQVASVWPRIRHHIEAAQRCGPTDHTIDELKTNCIHDSGWRLLVINNGDAAAIIRVYNQRLHGVSIGGQMGKGWRPDFLAWLKAAAACLELKGVTLCGRKGWARALKPLGFEPIGGGWLEARL